MSEKTFCLTVNACPFRHLEAVAVNAVGDAEAGTLHWRYLLAGRADVIVLKPLQLASLSVPPTSNASLVPALWSPLCSLIRLAQHNLSGGRTAAKYHADSRAEATRLLRVCGLAKPSQQAVAEVVEVAEWTGIDRALAFMDAKIMRRDNPRLSERHALFRAWRSLRPQKQEIGTVALDGVMRTLEKLAGKAARREVLASSRPRPLNAPDWLPEWERRTAAETGCSAAEAAERVAARVNWLLFIPDDESPVACHPIESVVDGIATAADRAAADGKALGSVDIETRVSALEKHNDPRISAEDLEKIRAAATVGGRDAANSLLSFLPSFTTEEIGIILTHLNGNIATPWKKLVAEGVSRGRQHTVRKRFQLATKGKIPFLDRMSGSTRRTVRLDENRDAAPAQHRIENEDEESNECEE